MYAAFIVVLIVVLVGGFELLARKYLVPWVDDLDDLSPDKLVHGRGEDADEVE